MSFDSTDRFEIGRYELTSVLSSLGFFTIGVMTASLNIAQWPTESDLVKNSVMNGATRSIICFSREVGIGSAVDDLSGSRRTALMTSSVVRDEVL